jgi:hypothetical protein
MSMFHRCKNPFQHNALTHSLFLSHRNLLTRVFTLSLIQLLNPWNPKPIVFSHPFTLSLSIEIVSQSSVLTDPLNQNRLSIEFTSLVSLNPHQTFLSHSRNWTTTTTRFVSLSISLALGSWGWFNNNDIFVFICPWYAETLGEFLILVLILNFADFCFVSCFWFWFWFVFIWFWFLFCELLIQCLWFWFLFLRLCLQFFCFGWVFLASSYVVSGYGVFSFWLWFVLFCVFSFWFGASGYGVEFGHLF